MMIESTSGIPGRVKTSLALPFNSQPAVAPALSEDAGRDTRTELNISAYSRSLVALINIQASLNNQINQDNVEMGRRIVREWKTPGDSQIDRIMKSVVEEA